MERDWTEFLYPIWEGAQVNGESICFCEDEAGRIDGGNLLYTPTRILSVQSADLERTYEEGRDYRVEGRRLIPIPGRPYAGVCRYAVLPDLYRGAGNKLAADGPTAGGIWRSRRRYRGISCG